MAIFVKHEPCPRCRSRDNLGRYSDGTAYCFGCGYVDGQRDPRRLESLLHNQLKEKKDVQPPTDLSNHFPRHVVEWLLRYGISIPEALKHGWKYSEYYDQLVFLFYDGNGEVEAYQARNFREGKKKYFTQGNVNEILPIFMAPKGVGMGLGLVVVEDVVSAAKISRQCDAMPCLGSHLPVKKITALKALGYERLVVWLDSNKFKEAQHISDMAKWLGLSSRAVYTEKDPKEYSDEEISNFLK